MIKIVGLGPGNPESITLAAVNAVLSAEVIAGAPRNLDSVAEFLQSVGQEARLKEIRMIHLERDLNIFLKEVGECQGQDTAVVVSGDPGFYSLLDTFRKAGMEVKAIPGISSYQYLYSQLGKSYKSHRLLSCHGRTADYIEVLKEAEGVFLLTDGENSPEVICKTLVEKKISGVTVHIGENLSYENEQIVSGKPEEFLDREFSILSAMIIEKE